MQTSNKVGKKVILHSLGWKVLERLCSQGGNFFIQIVLARLLLPSEFGSLAIMLAIINYAALFVHSGLATAIIQKKDLDAKDINTLFTASLFVALILYIVLYVSSTYISSIYQIPELVWPLRILSLVLFLNALVSVRSALFSRNMQFRPLFYRSVVAVPLSGVIGISLAYWGFGIWALVAHTLSTMIITLLLLSLYSEHKFRLEFNWYRAKKLYSFSVKILMSTLISGFGDTLRTLIIGRKYNVNDLAFYDKAYTYSSYFTQIFSTSIQSVLLPTFSRSQENIHEVKYMARKSVQLTSFLIIPMLTLVMSISSPFVYLFLTEKWAACIPFLIVFCMLRMPSCIAVIDKQVYYALGNSKIGLYYELGLLACNIAMLFVTIPHGVYAIAIGYLIIETIGCFALFCVSSFFYGYTLLERLFDMWRPIISSIILYGILSLSIFVFQSYLLEIFIKIVVGITLYIALSVILRDNNLTYIVNILKNNLIKGL